MEIYDEGFQNIGIVGVKVSLGEMSNFEWHDESMTP